MRPAADCGCQPVICRCALHKLCYAAHTLVVCCILVCVSPSVAIGFVGPLDQPMLYASDTRHSCGADPTCGHGAEKMAVSANSLSTMGSIAQTNDRESHWFDSERFLDPQFNAEQYVADLRRYVSLGPDNLQS